MRPATLLVKRRGPLVELRDGRGWTPVETKLRTYESMLTEVIDPLRAPELLWVREQVRSWRFYDHFRTDHEAPARLTQIGTRTPVLPQTAGISPRHCKRSGRSATTGLCGDDRRCLSGLGTRHPGRGRPVQSAVRRPRSAPSAGRGRAVGRNTALPPAGRRPAVAAAAQLMVLNEPETSLHPELLAPLARLIGQASKETQIMVVSHAAPLISALAEQPDCGTIELIKDFGETQVRGQRALDDPQWIGGGDDGSCPISSWTRTGQLCPGCTCSPTAFRRTAWIGWPIPTSAGRPFPICRSSRCGTPGRMGWDLRDASSRGTSFSSTRSRGGFSLNCSCASTTRSTALEHHLARR